MVNSRWHSWYLSDNLKRGYRSIKWFKRPIKFGEIIDFRTSLKSISKMKLFIIVFVCIKLIVASNFGMTGKQFAGDDESYLMHARRLQYQIFMNKLAQSQKLAVIQKQDNEAAARLRAKISMILSNGRLFFDMPNERPNSRKANNRLNRFQNYHNWSLNLEIISTKNIKKSVVLQVSFLFIRNESSLFPRLSFLVS